MPIPSPSDVRSSEITSEDVYRARRRLMAAGLTAPLLGLAGCTGAEDEPPPVAAEPEVAADPSGFRANEALTKFADVTSYNNFYEFGTDKGDPARYAGTLRPSPWSVEVAGQAETIGRFAIEDLLKGLTPQERIYRLRCVEGWSMVIPWLGVPLADVLRRFKPRSNAKYVAFTTLADPEQMPGLRYAALDWPYREGLRIDEAMHPLTLLATGLYGKPLPNQNGAPLRLIVPWKYGFKGAAFRIWLLFQRESASRSSALEPEDRAPHRRQRQQAVRRAHPDPAVQRLRRAGGAAVYRHGSAQVVLNRCAGELGLTPSPACGGPRGGAMDGPGSEERGRSGWG